MRELTASEMLQFRELLQLESTALAKAKAMVNAIGDDELKSAMRSGIQAGEARVKGIQQFINENDILNLEVH